MIPSTCERASGDIDSRICSAVAGLARFEPESAATATTAPVSAAAHAATPATRPTRRPRLM
jgi:hypothetical protein